jgi:hypothetical protein
VGPAGGVDGNGGLVSRWRGGIQRARATAPAGRPFRARDLERRAGGDRRLVVDAIGCRIAPLLPQAYRGVYDEAAPELDEPHRLAGEI